MTTDGPELLASYWLHAGDTAPAVGREWSAWDFETRVQRLAEVGFTGIGLTHTELRHRLTEHGETLADLRSVLDRHGLTHVELEILNAWLLPRADERRERERETREFLLSAAETLDAAHLKVGNFDGHRVPLADAAARFRTLCERAAAVDTAVGFEPSPVDPNVDSLDDALAVVEGAANGGLLLDSWHLAKLGVPTERLRDLDASDIVAAELADGRYDTDVETATEMVDHRELPGDGEFDLDGFVSALRRAGYAGPWGHEILSAEYRQRPMEQAYRQAYETAMAVLRR
ncbi:sugar phosphate isomerase/epimerase family protein [Haloarcula onubensis]|uniref:Sugar phosphate isomerase/epimerase n=1 Tax=Haloarcula onubensis TaxID=2950539 RepID=A0ABU2FNK3_9EURY|nr:sugar phosphate isomerase/epimerase [Halomicroarcula sp. S3CR25-11]MDS0282344.1 sugar phosphate isomerase/epimerase [Halomicroarcula sp. S3CR25-11]